MGGGPPAAGTGVKFCGLSFSWLQPTLILLVVSFIYCVYVGLNLLPSLQAINAAHMSDEGGGFISGAGTLESFINDPHATKMSFTTFVLFTLVFHVLLIMFATAFIKAIVTPPGSVPVQKQADRKVGEREKEGEMEHAHSSRCADTLAVGQHLPVSLTVLCCAEVGRWSVRHLSR